MPKMIIMVLEELEKLEDVLRAWERQGAGGATVIESSGLARVLAAGGSDDLPLFPGLRDLLRAGHVSHRTLFAVIGDEVDVEAFFDATEAVVGPLDAPNSGIILALPVLATRGLVRRAASLRREDLP